VVGMVVLLLPCVRRACVQHQAWHCWRGAWCGGMSVCWGYHQRRLSTANVVTVGCIVLEHRPVQQAGSQHTGGL
jgi:hypothetical protein